MRLSLAEPATPVGVKIAIADTGGLLCTPSARRDMLDLENEP
jgi:hypothetical protein